MVSDFLSGIVKAVGKGRPHTYAEKKKDDKFLTLQHRAPQAWVFSNIVAGSDSVGTVMQTFAYNLLTDPRTSSALVSELRSASLSKPFPKYSEVRDLPYLDACVNEAVRMHPPFCLPLERVVPEGGVTVSGVYLPGGTNVGGNGYVVNRNEEVFGADVDGWRPERWLECSSKQKSRMLSGMLTVGLVSPSLVHLRIFVSNKQPEEHNC
jgi:cytochrome P450